MKKLIVTIIVSIFTLLGTPPSLNAQCTIIPSDMETSIRTTTKRFFYENLPDIKRQFDELWIEYDIAGIYRRAVADAIDSTRAKYGMKRFITPFSKKKTREYCKEIITKIQNDSRLKSAITSLQNEMSKRITDEFTNNANLAASKTLNCILHYVRNEVGDALTIAFLNTTLPAARENISVILDSVKLGNFPFNLFLPIVTPVTLATAVIAVGSRLPSFAARTGTQIGEQALTREAETAVGEEVTEQIAQKTGVRLLARIITPKVIKGFNIVMTVIGVGIVSYEIWKTPQRIDNIIYDQFTSPHTIQSIKDSTFSVWSSFSDELAPKLVTMVSDTIISIWNKFQSEYKDLMTIAKEDQEIQNALDSIPSDKLPLLSTLASKLTKEKLVEAFHNGYIQEFINLPEKYQKPALKIAQDLNDVGLALKWIKRAGPKIDQVINSHLYMYIPPDQASIPLIRKTENLSEESLKHLSDLNDKTLQTIIELIPEDYLPTLIDSLPSQDLQELLTALGKIDPESRALLLKMLSPNISKWPNVKSVINDILKSPPAKRKDIILMALSDNPIVRIKKTIENPEAGIKLVKHDKYLMIIGFSILLLLLLLILSILKTFVGIIKSLTGS